jgi:hypothetical protein
MMSFIDRTCKGLKLDNFSNFVIKFITMYYARVLIYLTFEHQNYVRDTIIGVIRRLF